MEVYYKFKSAKDFDSISVDWHYTTVSDVKDYVLKKKCSGKRNKNHYDNLTLFNADTNQEYLDGETLIPKDSFLIIRRAPRCVCLPIVVNPPPVIQEQEEDELKEDNIFDEPSVSLYPEESEWVEFWNDLSPSEAVVPVQDAPPSKADEDRKIRAIIDTPALDWGQGHNPTDSFGPFGAGRGFGRGGVGMGGRSGGRGFGRGIVPPPGYICHRCKVSGHFIQHCPTNGDSTYDIKRTKAPTGIPNSMLMASPDGSYALPGGGVAVLKPNEAAFEKEIQGMPSTRSVVALPAELHCPLCKAVMKDAVLASKCCFNSFCDKCIRDFIMSKSVCACGATKVLADDLLPNKTVRDTIIQILESAKGSRANGGSAFQPQDMVPSPTLSAPSKGIVVATKSEGNTKVEEMTKPVEADNIARGTMSEVTVKKGVEVFEAVNECAREAGLQICPPVTDEDMQPKFQCLKVPLPTLSAPSKGIVVANKSEENTKVEEKMIDSIEADNFTQKTLDKVNIEKGVEVSESVHEYVEPVSNMCPPVTDEEMQQKPISGEVENKRKKFTNMQRRPYQDFADMPVESSGYYPYWNCMQPEFDGFDRPCGQIPFMGYGLGPMSNPFRSAFHHNPFGAQPYMMPIPPQRDLAKFGTGSNGQFHSQKTTIKQKQDHEKSGVSMEVSRDRDFSRDVISHEDIPSVKSKHKSISTPDYNRPRLERPSPERSTHDLEPIHTSSKRKVKHDDDYAEKHHHQPREKKHLHHWQLQDTVPPLSSKSSTEKKASDWKHKARVLDHLTFPEGESAVFKKRKLGNSSPVLNGSSYHNITSNRYHEDQCKTADVVWKNIYKYVDDRDYELSDDDRHFKRRPSRYETSPAPVVVHGRRHPPSRGWREKRAISSSISRLSVY